MEAERKRDLSLSRMRLRSALFGLGGALWITVVIGRLIHLQVIEGEAYRELAAEQHVDVRDLDPTRGAIYDRAGRVLAMSVEVESVGAAPESLPDPDSAAGPLARCVGKDRDEIANRLKNGKRFVWIERKADPVAADCVRGLEIPGISFVPESGRFYPNRTAASHVLGYVSTDNVGLYGIELAFEEEIRGAAGRQVVFTDARRRRTSSRVERQPVPGRSLFLTLDGGLQRIAESEIDEAVRATRSRSGMAILMRPDTGEILALAGSPNFNPNDHVASPPSAWRNRAVTDPYEPGSIFKIVTAAAALEENLVTEDERIDCGRGSIRVDGRTILDHHSYDILTFREVIENSSNVGAIRIGQRIGAERFLTYVRRFGFGRSTGIESKTESRGIVRDRWSRSTLASISFGQEIAVTPIQMVAAVNAVAASGYLMRPQLVREVRSADGTLFRSFAPEPVTRVVSGETARRLTDVLTGVVGRGTGKRAQIPGYTVAGKTGTAQKAQSAAGYSDTDFIASFVGFVPAEKPALTALVMLDAPVGDHSGGTVAASVFARIVERSLHYLGVPAAIPDRSIVVAERWPAQEPVAPASADETAAAWEPSDRARGEPEASPEASVGAALSPSATGVGPRRMQEMGPRREKEITPHELIDAPTDVLRASFGPARPVGNRMPSLLGLPGRDAVARAVAAGLVPRIEGSGRVTLQEPEEGAAIERGASCRIVLSETVPDAISGTALSPESVGAALSPSATGVGPRRMKEKRPHAMNRKK